MTAPTRADSPEGACVPDAERQLASLPHALVLLAPGQEIASVNPAAEQFFGQSLRRLRSRRLEEVLVFLDARLSERMRDSEAPVSARDIEVSVPGLGKRRLDLCFAPVVDQQGWQVLTLHDAATEARGDDSGAGEDAVLRGPEILAHEIKNPLAGIRGAAQLLSRRANARDRALTELIAGEVDRITVLIDQMQALSRRTPAPLQPCNLHEAARRAIAVLDIGGDGKVAIQEEFDPSLPAVMGNSEGLARVLINLASNAIEASRAHAVPRVVIRTRFASGLQVHSAGDGRSVRLPIELRVSDNGPGIDPAMREHVFEPFVTTKAQGQGLGLALVRKLVRDMRGRVSHERDEAAGWTHFRVHLPRAQDASPSQRSEVTAE